MAKSMLAMIKRTKITTNVFLRDMPNNFVSKAPNPREGMENPLITIAIILAMGIKIIAGKKIIACALGG